MLTSVSDGGLVVDGLAAGYGATIVVRELSLHVDPGEFVCVLGPNGAGKSTLLRGIVGAARVFTGSVLVGGHAVHGRASHRITRMGVAIVPEGRAIVPDLSVRDNLLLGSAARDRRRRSPAATQAVDELFERFPRLAERRAQAAGSMSGGEQQLLAVARALASRPKLLILDEPSLGLAPKMVHQVFAELTSVNRNGVTVLVAEQNAAAALRATSRAYVMSGGRVVMEGNSAQIQQSGRLRTAFLGE
jgi:branched-chain amino acid transport system ATP-binding protein